MAGPTDIEQGSSFEGETFERLDLAGSTLREKSFDRCTFHACDLGQSRFEACHLTECAFEDCDLGAARFAPRNGVRQVTFRRCKLVGLVWEIDSPFASDVVFEGCDLGLASFLDTSLENARFDDCRALEIHFEGVNLRAAAFPATRLEGAVFERCDLIGADLSQAEGYLIDPRLNRLGETRFSLAGGRDLLALQGIQLPGFEPRE